MCGSYALLYEGEKLSVKVVCTSSFTAEKLLLKVHHHHHHHHVHEEFTCFLFFDPQDEFGPSISSSVILFSFVLLVYIVVLVLVFCCGFTLSRSHSCCAVRLVYTQISPGHI